MNSKTIWERLNGEEKALVFTMEVYRARGIPLPVDVMDRASELNLLVLKEDTK